MYTHTYTFYGSIRLVSKFAEKFNEHIKLPCTELDPWSIQVSIPLLRTTVLQALGHKPFT